VPDDVELDAEVGLSGELEMEVTRAELTCARCHKQFTPTNSIEELLADLEERFGDVADEGVVLVCDPCCQEIVEHADEGICGRSKHGYLCRRRPFHKDAMHAAVTDTGMMATWIDGVVGVNVRPRDPRLWGVEETDNGEAPDKRSSSDDD
jgi:hypothetical protein